MIDNLIIGTSYHAPIVGKYMPGKNKVLNMSNKKDLIKSSLLFPFSKKIIYVYSPVGNRKYILLLQILNKIFRKNILIFWIGTDVLDAQKPENEKSKNFLVNSKKIKNFTECHWLSTELSNIGINSTVGPYITYSSLFEDSFNEKSEYRTFHKKLIILTYARSNREEFYGLNIIKDLAIEHPDIEFRIVGVDNEDTENIKYLGWIDKNELKKQYLDAHIFLRIPEHDGLSYSVLEAMYNGLYVIFNYQYPNTFFSERNKDSVSKLIIELKDKIAKEPFNKSAHLYIEKNYVLHNQSEINIKKVKY
ncbi:glycosyl hydrolase family 1 [Providencia rettgeri]|uniref:glycosyl hydrolase family 1 n=1 Tax=Providencia sp. PROV164 TaxID=2949871 RepID=UPI00234C033E|nr:glycosyl hydrolase family 1 [Providencia sp. PROV164]ELR5239598.1 glycosyl hydrolase family 1 [Providencia rettgeri]